MITLNSHWRCKCGLRLKAIGETEDQPQAVSVAACPRCHDTQEVNCHRINSVTVEQEGSAKIE